jgi:hypothetical protein
MAKFTLLVLVGLVAVISVQTSLADYQRQAADGLREAEFESWLRRRSQVENARAVDNQLERERELTGANQQTTIPEASNYAVVAEPLCFCVGFDFWGACLGWSGCKRKRRSVGFYKTRETGSPRVIVPPIIIIGSAAEMKLYSDPEDRQALYNSPVARAELVSRPLDPATPVQVSDALGGLQHAVVATLTDGRRFLVVKGNQKGEGSETIVILADHMTDDWTKVTTKDVSQSTLFDFVKAGGTSFDPLKDNGTQAAARIMALP